MANPPTHTDGPPDWRASFQAGESLLWQGTPKPGLHGLTKIIGLALFGLPFLIMGIAIGVAGIWQMYSAKGWSDAGLGLFFIAFAIPFSGIGAGMEFGPVLAARSAHRNTRYALSTRSAYIAKTGRTRRIDSYPVLRSTATGLEKGRTADTVWFHVHKERGTDGDTTTRVGFDNIAAGEAVFHLIRSLQKGQP